MARYNKKLPKMFDKNEYKNLKKKYFKELSPESIAALEEEDNIDNQIKQLKNYFLLDEYRNDDPLSFENVKGTRDVLISYGEWTEQLQEKYEQIAKRFARIMI